MKSRVDGHERFSGCGPESYTASWVDPYKASLASAFVLGGVIRPRRPSSVTRSRAAATRTRCREAFGTVEILTVMRRVVRVSFGSNECVLTLPPSRQTLLVYCGPLSVPESTAVPSNNSAFRRRST